MKKIPCLLLIMFLVFHLTAEEASLSHTENANHAVSGHQNKPEQYFFTHLKFGLGVDFDGMQGHPVLDDLNTTAMRNQLGATLGIDFGWSVFRKTTGKGAGDLSFGFGFDFQYWAPTTHMSRDNYDTGMSWGAVNNYDEMDYAYIHYMRVPVTLNAAYEFKVNAGTLRRTGLWFSLGVNNNFFFLDYHSDDEETQNMLDESFKDISHWKISGTWLLGLNMVFDNNWIFKASIGGDFGKKMVRSHLFFKDYRNRDPGKFARMFYGHHEFLMFETGYRFGFGK